MAKKQTNRSGSGSSKARSVSQRASSLKYERAKKGDIPEVARLITLGFAGTLKGSTKWVRDNGLENIRVVRSGKSIPACLRRIEMGQFFGGRSVKLCGIAGVATAPEARGKGIARWMMEECVREMYKRGEAIGGLYASTQALYRQSGFEQAGSRFQFKVPIARLMGGAKARNVIALKDSDSARIEQCYRRFAAANNGMLDRSEYIWKRIKARPDAQFQGYGVLDERRELSGYLFMLQQREPENGRQDLFLSDIAFVNADAGKQLISFLADYEPVADSVVLQGGPIHPLLTLLPQQRYEAKLKYYWMLRLVDVKKALESRGYLSAVRTGLDIEVTDEVVPENAGRWRIEVANGRATAKRTNKTGRVGVSCGIRGLAAMYTGLYSPRQAAAVGLCEGDEKSLDSLGAVFAGGAPWMPDHY